MSPRVSPLPGAALAIAVTTAMDATGLGMFSALPLLPLAGLFWYLERLPRREVGLTPGAPPEYLPAIAYPVLVVGGLALAAALAGQVDRAAFDPGHAGRNVLLVGATTTIMTILTEEGFFRGWLWASLARRLGPGRRVWLGSSVLFMLWHVSAVTLMDELVLPARQVPIYLANVLLIGLVWGRMRARSGSLIVPALSHGLWNGLTYVLFGFGQETGQLGIADTATWGPETGWLGILGSGLFLLGLMRLPAAARR